MTATNTFTWKASGSGNWSSSGNWGAVSGGSGNFSTGANGVNYLFVLGGSGSYTVTVNSASIDAGAVTVDDAAATLAVGANTLEATYGAPAGGAFQLEAGTVTIAGGQLGYWATTISSGTTLSGYGTLEDIATTGLSLSVSGNLVASGGTLKIEGYSTSGEQAAVSGNLQIDGGAALYLDEATIANGAATVTFDNQSNKVPGTAVVQIGASVTDLGTFSASGSTYTFNATLDNMVVGSASGADTNASAIQLYTGVAATSAKFLNNYSQIEVITTSKTYIFNTSGTTFTSQDTVNTSYSGGYDTIWIDTNPCYAAGTRILTDRGEVPVEELAEGDMLVTLAGDTRSSQPIKWIGERKLDLRQHPQPNLVAPVRISAHAVGPHLPQRDLLVSPDHCLFIDGKLVPAKLLINDMTIVQERDTRSVHYYHIELDRHSVLLAEGLPAESYLDTGNRAMFANAGLALVLHPEFALNAHLKCWEIDACAPLTVKPDAVKPIWDRLAERAESLGYQRAEPVTTDDPDLHLLVDGRTIRPISQVDGRFVFTLPARTGNVRLMSRASVPSHVEPYLDDWRNLGVAVRRIVVRDTKGFAEIAPDHPGLSDGWYQVERDNATMWRWTNGDALLPIARIDWPVMVEVHVGIVRPYTVAEIKQDRLAA